MKHQHEDSSLDEDAYAFEQTEKEERSMKIKAVRYGRVVPARDGTRFSTERCEVELEAEDGETFEQLLCRAQALVAIGVGEIDLDQLRRDKVEIDDRLAALGRAGL